MELNLEAALGAADADEDASPAQASLAVLLATQSAERCNPGASRERRRRTSAMLSP